MNDRGLAALFGRAFGQLDPRLRITLAVLGAILAVVGAVWLLTWAPDLSVASLVYAAIVIGLTVVTLVRYVRVIRAAIDEGRHL